MKNKFKGPNLYDIEIVDENYNKVGAIRIKPSTVMWCPKGAKGATPYFGVTIEQFEEWIMNNPNAKKMAQ